MASARSGNALGPIQRLFDEGTLTGLTDAQPLDRFLIGRDEAAFAFLVARHGPMVLAVCRGVLKNRDDAEDAFQATFLVLFRKAGGLRVAGSLGSWLYRVAYRIALRANAVAARRRERSSEEDVMAAEAASTGEPGVDRELLPIIHAEIDRLPDRYRAPIALCYLEGLSYEQAAHQLGWPIGTVGSRIARARELLRSRLARRGVIATTAVLSALLAREATAAPSAWIEATTRAAMGIGGAAGGAKAAGAVSAAVALSDGFLRRMLMIRLIQMTCVITVAAPAGLLAWASIVDGGGPKNPAAPAMAAQAKAQARPANEPKKNEAAHGPIRGRALAPDGKPVRDAAIYVGQAELGWIVDPVARTDADGRFAFDVDEASRIHRRGAPPLDPTKVVLTAYAAGYGPVCRKVTAPDGGNTELRLIADDVPIRGRVLDTQGRPIPGVTVRVETIQDPPSGDLDALLRFGALQQGPLGFGAVGPGLNSSTYYETGWWIKEGSRWTQKTIKTGPDGRFRIDGAGRDRFVFLKLEGPGIGNASVWTMSRAAPPSARPRPRATDPTASPRLEPLHGATFDYVASPSKPIEGVVRAKGTGRPLAGAQVSGWVYEAGVHAEATTDNVGRFRLDGLPKVATYHLNVHPAFGHPYLPARLDVSDTDGLKSIPVTIDLVKGVSVRVRLIDESTGKSVAGNHVQHVRLPSNPIEGDAAGIFCSFGPEGFRMIVPPGPGFFYAEAAGENLPYTRARLAPADRGKGVGGEGDGEFTTIILSPCHSYRIVDVPAGVETFDVDLELTRGTSRKGRLVDPEGKPVAGVQAYGLGSNWEVKTLEGASFEVTALEPGKPRSVSFMHKGRRLAGAVALEPGEAPVEVRLAPCGAATGRLVDSDGQPMGDAYLMLIPRDHSGRPIPLGIGLWPQGEGFAVDKDGRFRVEGINPALGVGVDIHSRSHPGRFLVPEKSKEELFRHLKSRPGETVNLGEIRMIRQSNE